MPLARLLRGVPGAAGPRGARQRDPHGDEERERRLPLHVAGKSTTTLYGILCPIGPPTDPFTNKEPQNMSIDFSKLNKVRRPADFQAQNLNVRNYSFSDFNVWFSMLKNRSVRSIKQ